MLTYPIELDIRNQLNKQLENLGWNLDRTTKQNVYIEQPRTQEEKVRLQGRKPDYVLYPNDDSIPHPLIVIETKKPGSNLNDALNQGKWYANKLYAPMVFATDGLYYKTLHTKFEKPLIINGEEVDELLRELQAIQFLNNNEIDTVSKSVKYSRRELIKIFADSNEILRDEGLRAGIERFSEFANILFLKLVGEIESLKEEQGQNFTLTRDLRWESWKNKTGYELLNYVNDVILRRMGEKYNDDNIFSQLLIKNPTVLKKIIDKLDPLNLINIDSDIKGDSFEFFLKQSTATKNDLGEYFTPRHIVKMMVKLANPQIGEKIYDPFCGTGGLLIESFKHIYNTMKHTPSNLDQLRKNSIYGNEITNTARITKMNMILAGDGHSNIQMTNSLKNPVDDIYDVVMTNMPYSQKTEYGGYYDLASSNGDSICIQHCIRAVNKASEDGRMAIVVPEGFLFRRDMQKTREYLLSRCTLRSIISLPQGVFLPYTGVKTDVIYCTNVKKNIKKNNIWYFEVKDDGYTLDNNRKRIEGEDDLKKFLEFRNVEKQEEKDVFKVGFIKMQIEDVLANDLILIGNRYREVISKDKQKWPMVELRGVANILSGQSPDGKYYNERGEGLPFYQGKTDFGNVYINQPRKWTTQITTTALKHDVLLSVRAPVGPVNLATEKICIGRGLAAIRPSEKLLSHFLFYLIKENQEVVKRYANGSTFEAINKKQVETLKIPLPPIGIQEEIIRELEQYQKIIEGARQVVESWKPSFEIDPKWVLKRLGDVCDVRDGTHESPKHVAQEFLLLLQKIYYMEKLTSQT